MFELKYLKAAIVAVAAFAGSSAFAGTITLYGGDGPSTPWDYTEARADIDCSACSAITFTGDPTSLVDDSWLAGAEGGTWQWSATSAGLFDLGNSSEQGEIDFVNGLVGPVSTGSGQVAGGGGDLVFPTDALYILLKIGTAPNYALIRNDGTGEQEFSFDAFTGEGAGLSHYVLFGKVSVIPLPATGLLLLGALGGLGALSRRRKA